MKAHSFWKFFQLFMGKYLTAFSLSWGNLNFKSKDIFLSTLWCNECFFQRKKWNVIMLRQLLGIYGVLSNVTPNCVDIHYHVLLVSYQFRLFIRLSIFCGHFEWPSNSPNRYFNMLSAQNVRKSLALNGRMRRNRHPAIGKIHAYFGWNYSVSPTFLATKILLQCFLYKSLNGRAAGRIRRQ